MECNIKILNHYAEHLILIYMSIIPQHKIIINLEMRKNPHDWHIKGSQSTIHIIIKTMLLRANSNYTCITF